MVSREIVCIAFLITSFNDLHVCAADIGNVYLNAECEERIWVKAGKEFGAIEGKPMIIVKALYGLKSSGAVWRNLLFKLNMIPNLLIRGKPYHLRNCGQYITKILGITLYLPIKVERLQA